MEIHFYLSRHAFFDEYRPVRNNPNIYACAKKFRQLAGLPTDARPKHVSLVVTTKEPKHGDAISVFLWNLYGYPYIRDNRGDAYYPSDPLGRYLLRKGLKPGTRYWITTYIYDED